MSEQPPNPYALPPADEPQGYVGPDGRLVSDHQQSMTQHQQSMAVGRPPLTDGRSRATLVVSITLTTIFLVFVIAIVIGMIAFRAM